MDGNSAELPGRSVLSAMFSARRIVFFEHPLAFPRSFHEATENMYLNILASARPWATERTLRGWFLNVFKATACTGLLTCKKMFVKCKNMCIYIYTHTHIPLCRYTISIYIHTHTLHLSMKSSSSEPLNLHCNGARDKNANWLFDAVLVKV